MADSGSVRHLVCFSEFSVHCLKLDWVISLIKGLHTVGKALFEEVPGIRLHEAILDEDVLGLNAIDIELEGCRRGQTCRFRDEVLRFRKTHDDVVRTRRVYARIVFSSVDRFPRNFRDHSLVMNNLGTIFARLVVLIAERAIAFLREEVVELVPPDAKWLRFGVVAGLFSLLLRLFNQFEPSLINLGLCCLRLIERAPEITRTVNPVRAINSCNAPAFFWTAKEVLRKSSEGTALAPALQVSDLVSLEFFGSAKLVFSVGVACCKSDGED